MCDYFLVLHFYEILYFNEWCQQLSPHLNVQGPEYHRDHKHSAVPVTHKEDKNKLPKRRNINCVGSMSHGIELKSEDWVGPSHFWLFSRSAMPI